MIKNSFYLIILCFANYLHCQSSIDSLIKPRYSFSSSKEYANSKYPVIINEKDTLYGYYSNKIDLEVYNDSNYSESIFYIYRLMVFKPSDKNNKYYLKQWNTPIIVYLDEKLPSFIAEKFEDFWRQIKGIKNFEIKFTKNINEANYYIKVSDKEVNSYSKNKKFSSEEAKKEHLYSGITYTLTADGNWKYYSCLLKINIDDSKSNLQRLKQLKILFFRSLFQFKQNSTTHTNEESLTNVDYNNSEKINSFDLDLLKLHYSNIYNQKINLETFDRIVELNKKTNE